MAESANTKNLIFFISFMCITNVLKESLFFCYEGDLPPAKILYQIGKAWSENNLRWRRSEVAWVEDAITQYFSWWCIGNLCERSLRGHSSTYNQPQHGNHPDQCLLYINQSWTKPKQPVVVSGQYTSPHLIRKVRLVHCNHAKHHKKGQI